MTTSKGTDTDTDIEDIEILAPDGSSTWVSKEVLRGASLLDEHYPDWINIIATEVLDLSSPTYCILGQLGTHEFGDTFYPLTDFQCYLEDAVGTPPTSELHNYYFYEDHGFETLAPDAVVAYKELTRQWRALIEYRHQQLATN